MPASRVKPAAVPAEVIATPEPVASNGRHPILLTREQILDAQDVRTEVVDVPEWGGSVMVRGLTGRARDKIEARFADEKGNISGSKAGDFRALFVALSVVDDSGALIFDDVDVAALGEKSSTALQRVFDVAVRLSAVRPGDIDGMADELKGDLTGDIG